MLARQYSDPRTPPCRGEKETHFLAEQKQAELARLRDAWGLKDPVEGEAFNRDIQEAKKQARIEQREKDKLEREERRQREADARAKAAKDAEKRRKQVPQPQAITCCLRGAVQYWRPRSRPASSSTRRTSWSARSAARRELMHLPRLPRTLRSAGSR